MNTKAFSHFDEKLRTLVDEQYDFCLYKCGIKTGPGMLNCKNDCFKNVHVPFRFHNHAARENEDNDYKRCLSEKFPNITQDDYVECTHKIYKDRVKILSDYMLNVSTGILSELH